MLPVAEGKNGFLPWADMAWPVNSMYMDCFSGRHCITGTEGVLQKRPMLTLWARSSQESSVCPTSSTCRLLAPRVQYKLSRPFQPSTSCQYEVKECSNIKTKQENPCWLLASVYERIMPAEYHCLQRIKARPRTFLQSKSHDISRNICCRLLGNANTIQVNHKMSCPPWCSKSSTLSGDDHVTGRNKLTASCSG